MKNLRITGLMIFALVAFSCSSSEEDGGSTGLLNTPVAGKIYGNTFAISSTGGYASNLLDSGVEKVYVNLTAQSVGCNAPDATEFPVTVLVPRTVGTYTTNVSATFRDPDSTDYVTISNLTVEIISVGTTVVGRVMATSVSTDNTINGKFEVPYCN